MSATDTTPTDDSLADLVADLQARIEDLEADRDRLEAENEQLRDRVDELEADLDDVRDHAGQDRADLSRRLHDLEERDGDHSAPASDGKKKPSSPTPQTPLEQVVNLPEHLAEEQLSANQRRARFVAKDVTDYGQHVPAGWTISSTDLRRILRAADESSHTQTVQRVMEIASDLGGDDVWTVKRRGTRRLVFSDEVVDRLDALDGPNHDVVMTAEA